MQNSSSKFARPIDVHAPAWERVRSGTAHTMIPQRTQREGTQERRERLLDVHALQTLHAPRAFGLSAEEQERYLRVVADSLQIHQHYELFLWLQGELQAFLPHEIFIAAWGNFAQRGLNVDIVSCVPGVRTGELAHCNLDVFLKTSHARWVKAQRMPVEICAAEIHAALNGACQCPIHGALRAMRSIVVHGVCDKRGSPESIYIALHSGSLTQGRPRERFASLVDSLIAPIDIAFRKIGMLPPANGRSAGKLTRDCLDLSAREQEILDFVCSGKTNVEVAAALSISPFTVKNHVQRIFRKINVTNRTEAAAKYNLAQREIEKYL